MSEIEELIAHLETQKTTPTVDRLISKVKEQEQEIEACQKQERANLIGFNVCSSERFGLQAKVAEQDREMERLREEADTTFVDAAHEAIARADKAEARIQELEQELLWAAEACEKAENLLAEKGKPCTCGTGYDPECPSGHGAEKEKV